MYLHNMFKYGPFNKSLIVNLVLAAFRWGTICHSTRSQIKNALKSSIVISQEKKVGLHSVGFDPMTLDFGDLCSTELNKDCFFSKRKERKISIGVDGLFEQFTGPSYSSELF